MTRLGAILLAGGRATRVDGAAKPLLEIDGETLLARALEAARAAGCAPIVAVGPNVLSAPDLTWVREDPPFGGPAAAIVAAAAALPAATEWTLVLACDLARPGPAVRQLREDLLLVPDDTEGICLADAASRPQWLTGLYRAGALRTAALALPDAGRNAPAHALFADLAVAVTADRYDATDDIDTWEDLHRARSREKEGRP